MMVESIRELRKICQEPPPQLPFLTKLYNRFSKFFSIYITKILLYTKITANQLNLIMFLIALIGIYLISIANFKFTIIGIIILHLEALLDAVDGEIARYQKKASPMGYFIDTLTHSAIHPLIFMAITINIYKSNPSILVVTFGFLGSIFMILSDIVSVLKHEAVFMQIIKSEQSNHNQIIEKKKINQNNQQAKSSSFKKVYKELNPILKYYVFLFALLFAGVFNQLYLLLIFYAITLPINWIVLSIY